MFLHQGGPACEGLTIAKVEERLRPNEACRACGKASMHFVCPWHGMEYDMKTAASASGGSRKMKLRSYKVLQKGDEIYVVA